MCVCVCVCVCVGGWVCVQMSKVEHTFPGEDCVRFLLWFCCGPARLKIADRSGALTFDDGSSPNPPSQMVHLIHTLFPAGR